MKRIGLVLFISICLTIAVLLITKIITVIVGSALFVISMILFLRLVKRKPGNT